MSGEPANPDAIDTPSGPLAWMAPGYRGEPAEALVRIRTICELMPDLFSATLAVSATHQGLPKEILAAALRQFRRDAEGLTVEDMTGLINSLLNGGRQAFEATLRSRRRGERKPISTPWVKD